MIDGDEEIDNGTEPDPKDTADSTASEDTEGQDTGAGDDEGESTTQHADDTEDDGEPQQGQTPDRSQAQTQSRGSGRIQRLANEAKEARERADKATRELEEFKRQQWINQQQQNERVEQERRALMTPAERTEYDLAQMRNAMGHMQRQTAMQFQMAVDKTSFDAKATTNPLYKRYAAQVEQRFQDQLAKGAPVEREVLLRQIIGDEAVTSASNPSARRAANGRVNAQRVKAANNKGDQATARSGKKSSAEERLKGVFI